MSQLDSERILSAPIDETERILLESAKDDAPDLRARDRMLAALAAAPAPTATRVREALRAGGASSYVGALALLAAVAAVAVAIATPWETHSMVGTPPPAQPSVAGPAITTAAPPPVLDDGPSAVPLLTPDLLPSVPRPKIAAPKSAAPKRMALPAPEPSADSEPRPSSLSREIVEIEAARTSLAAGDAAKTLVTLDRYDRDFPKGAFAVESSVLRIEALARSGRTDEARRLGTRFLETHRNGAFSRRVAITLESMTPHRTGTPVLDSSGE